MNKKIYAILTKAVFVLCTVLIAIIMMINLFSFTEYTGKKTFAMPNIVLLSIGALCVVLALVACENFHNKKLHGDIKRASVILFLLQGYTFFNIYFISHHWDAWNVFCNAQRIAQGQTEELSHFYFSIYPNNQFIVFVMSLLVKLDRSWGIFDTDHGLLLIILIQCALTTVAGKILFDIIKEYTNTEKMAWFGWAFYVVLLGLSGWNIVTYTDIMGMIVPLLILRLYQLLQNGKNKYLIWFGMISLSFWGFKIKPTAVIVFLAILLAELIEVIKGLDKQKKKSFAVIALIGVISLPVYSGLFTAMIESTGLEIDAEANVGPLHMVMMGLNPENHGGYYNDDVQLSMGIKTKEERTKAQKEVIKQRMADYGFTGFVHHLWKKTLMIYNDGTFAWGYEGGFFDEVFEDKNLLAAPFLKKLYYTNGAYYKVLSTVEQLFWLTTLAFSAGIVILKKNRMSMVLGLSLIGIILFIYIFEARARYLILYVPFFIIAASLTMYHLAEYLKERTDGSNTGTHGNVKKAKAKKKKKR